MSNFKDHFSAHAAAYRDARPDYPPALFDWLAAQAPGRALAWDAGCGNGQASTALGARFDRVIATDASAEQIAQATARPNIEYRVEPAEATTLQSGSVDLVTVAQALHWFDQDRFHAEVRRVTRPRALIAVWTYGLCVVSAEVDAVIARFYDDIVGPYWPPERSHTMDGYVRLPFPFAEFAPPHFDLDLHWSLPQFRAYVATWSAVQRYRKARGTDPLERIEDALAQAWGDANHARRVRWPLGLRVGRVHA